MTPSPSNNPALAPNLPPSHPNPSSSPAVLLVALLVTIIPAVLWPGDAPWLWDEPLEIAIALDANQNHQLAPHGLSGGFPFPYGPLGIQAIQLCLLFTHNPIILVLYHALLCAVPTALALLWLARTLQLPVWFALAVLASPYLSFEARRLWQPSFCIPLTAMAVAAYASFLTSRARLPLLLAIACAIAPLFIHLQALPLSIALLAHLLLRHRPTLYQHRWPILALLALFLLLNFPYLLLANSSFFRSLPLLLLGGHNSQTPFANACWTPFLAGNLLSGHAWIKLWTSKPTFLTHALAFLSSIPIPLVWAGIALAAWHLLPLPRGRPQLPALLPKHSPRRTLLAVALTAFAIQWLLFASLRIPSTHHFFFGTFGLHVLFAWIAVAAVPPFLCRSLLIGAYALAVSAVNVYSIQQVHRHSWPRWFCPTLQNQITLVHHLNAFSDRYAHNEVPAYSDRPEILGILRRLYPPQPPQNQQFSGRLFIRFQPSKNPDSGFIELIQTDLVPPHAKSIPLHQTQPR